MQMSPEEFRQLSILSGELIDGANLLLDMAEQEQDEQMAMRIVERAREIMAVSDKIVANLQWISERDSPAGKSLADREPSLREVIARAYETHTKAAV